MLAGLNELIFQSGSANSRGPNRECSVSAVQMGARAEPSVIISQELQNISATVTFLATDQTNFSGRCTTGHRGNRKT